MKIDELYEIDLNGQLYLLTSSSRDVLHSSGKLYKATAIKRGEQKLTSGSTDTLNFTLPASHAIATPFLDTPPDGRTEIKLFKYINRTTTVALFTGHIAGCDFGGSKANLTCRPILANTQKIALRYSYQYQCNHQIYDSMCKLDLASNSVYATVNSVSSDGLTITSDELVGQTAQYYPGGLVIYKTMHRMISTYDPVAGAITMLTPVEGLTAGIVIQVARGCVRSPDSCKAIGNYSKYLGFRAIPNNNPFISLE